MSRYLINHANIKEWAKNYDGEPFDAILCDPPYELGFMGKSWDSSGIAFDQEMWADLFRHIKPGGHLLAFSGSRTYHRMAVAIEDAGFEIRDMIEYVYGSGFPKSLNIGKSVEAFVTTGNASKNGFHKLDGERRDGRIGMYDTVEEQGFRVKNPDQLGAYDLDPTTDEAKQWNGYGTALKPAHEPICMARKPLDSSSICENCEGRGDVNIGAKECWVCNGTGKIKSKKLSVAENVLKYGTGGLNIDGTRVGTEQRINNANGATAGGARIQQLKPGVGGGEVTGRFPANLIHDGSDEVVAVFPTNNVKGSAVRKNKANPYGGERTWSVSNTPAQETAGYADSGSASRFFYTAKASKSERNAGLEGFEEKDSTARQVASEWKVDARSPDGGYMTAPQAKATNHHPTVKPLSLTKYLATLIKPPTGGRLLVPFSGSGSEMIGALQAGWEYVEGVELTEEYIPIAEARIKHWMSLKEEESNQLELV